MLPKNATNVYGKGTAGEVWRSMLAERIGEELAKSGQIGVAERLESSARQPIPAASEASPGATPASGQLPAPAPAAAPANSEVVAEAAQWSTSIQPSNDWS
jgi:hypothetical protein